MPTLLQHIVLSFFFIVIFHGGFVLSQGSSGSQTCPPSYCGNKEIKYPLWLKNSSNPNPADFICGYPDLGIDCENQTTVLHAGNDTYIIDDVDYEKGIFNFKHRDLQQGSCPRARHNLTLISMAGFPLEPYDITFIRFHFNCSIEENLSPWLKYSLSCLGRNNGKQSYGFLKEWELGSGFPLWFCEGLVESPVKKPEIAVDLESEFPVLLRDGFNLRLNDTQMNECLGCEGNKGTCTYVQTGRATEKYEFSCGNAKQGSPTVDAGTIGAALGGLFSLLVLSGVGILVVKKIVAARRRKKSKEEEDDEVEHAAGMPRRFSLKELQVATQDFSRKLGQGGFGSVFEGRIDAQLVAVKRLDCITEGKKQFLVEVQTIGRIHHFNLVKLVGYCAEKSSKLLVYEFMPNSSLDNWIFPRKERALLGWAIRRKIIIGIAKGLAYLHEECAQKIAHLDIKPQNILLDQGFEPKISDFGLAKLIDRDQTQVETRMRGTIGYLAPEWLSCMITEKADVYSFGVVTLEIVSKRRNFDRSLPEDKALLVELARRKAQAGELGDLIDSNLNCTEQESEEATKILQLGLWCLLQDHNKRPSMSTVVKLLEGTAALELNYEDGYPAPGLLLDLSHSEASGSTPLLASVLSGLR